MMMSSCKLWNTGNGKDIRTFQFTNHDYSNAVVHYISLSPEDEWLAVSISVGVTIVSIIICYNATIIQCCHLNCCMYSTSQPPVHHDTRGHTMHTCIFYGCTYCM